MSLPKVHHNWAYRNVLGLIFLGVFLAVGSYMMYVASLHAQSIELTMEASCDELAEQLKKMEPSRSMLSSPSLQFAYDKYFEECV